MSVIPIEAQLQYRFVLPKCYEQRSCARRSFLRFMPANNPVRLRRICSPTHSASANGYPHPALPGNDNLNDEDVDRKELHNIVRRFFEFLPSILPGGEWWNFSEEVGTKFLAEPVTLWRALSRMWLLVAPDRWVIIAAFCALIIAALSEISIPHYLTASIFSAKGSDVVVFHKNVRLMIILCLVSGICSGLRSFFFGIANMIIVKRLRETLYSALLFQDISFFDEETVGDLTSRLGSDCQQVSRVIGHDLNFIFRNVVQGAGSLIYLLILSWPLGLCTFFICATLAAILTKYGRYQKKGAKLNQDVTASANMVAQEALSLIRTVRVYGTESFELRRYNLWLDKLADISMRQSAAFGVWNFSFNMLYHSTQVAAVLIGGISILAGTVTAEQLTKFILYSEWLIYSTWLVGDNLSSMMKSIGASEKVFQMIDLPPGPQFTNEGKTLQRMIGRIELVNLSFSYHTRPEVSVLNSINLKVHAGEVVAIVGLSGSGKSTLVNLLLRLYEPTSGQIYFDGVLLQDLDIQRLREAIGYVGQEPKLFRMDVSANISYGCPRAVTREEIEHAAKQAYAHEFISALPDGYQTIVDDDLLSGGQKQRVAIARAMLRDPSVLILDEATSALDAESELNVKGIIHSAKNGSSTTRTVIVIAHRLSTIQAANRIVVMDRGEIVEMGSHKELILRNGVYARLVRSQADALA